jgi:hypothetical protein
MNFRELDKVGLGDVNELTLWMLVTYKGVDGVKKWMLKTGGDELIEQVATEQDFSVSFLKMNTLKQLKFMADRVHSQIQVYAANKNPSYLSHCKEVEIGSYIWYKSTSANRSLYSLPKEAETTYRNNEYIFLSHMTGQPNITTMPEPLHYFKLI